MRKFVTIMMALALFGLAVPGAAQAAPRTAHAGTYDCSAGGSGWADWQYVGPANAGAGTICPDLSVTSGWWRAWDKASDGKCIGVFYQINPGATVYFSGVQACGLNVISAGATPGGGYNLVLLGRYATGHSTWADVEGFAYLCYPDASGC